MATTAQEDETALAKAKTIEGGGERAGEESQEGKTCSLDATRRAGCQVRQLECLGSHIRASGSPVFWPMIFVSLILSQGANIVTSLWLSWWTSDKFGFSTGTYIAAYACLGLSQAILLFSFSTFLTTSGTNASRVLLQKAMTRTLRAPMSFFDTTPLGRITNRFSKDVDSMDNSLTDAMRMYFLTLAMITSVFSLIIAYFHYFAVALGPLFILFYLPRVTTDHQRGR